MSLPVFAGSTLHRLGDLAHRERLSLAFNSQLDQKTGLGCGDWVDSNYRGARHRDVSAQRVFDGSGVSGVERTGGLDKSWHTVRGGGSVGTGVREVTEVGWDIGGPG
jgi:hypothetical protein